MTKEKITNTKIIEDNKNQDRISEKEETTTNVEESKINQKPTDSESIKRAQTQKIKKLTRQIEAPMVQQEYQYAIDLLLAKLRLINADLTERNNRPMVRNFSSRIKQTDSIVKKLIKKGRELTFETATGTLNDIAGIRAVCYFSDDIYQIVDAVRRQTDLTIIKEKDYVTRPKKSGYQSIHLIVEVPVTYLDKTRGIRVEVQIRSFAMDYWAELDTQMCYKKDAGEIENVEKETKKYSDVIAKVDTKMLELRKRIEKM